MPTFISKNGLLPTFKLAMPTFYKFLPTFLMKNFRFCGHLPGFCPLLKAKSGQQNLRRGKGFLALLPTCPGFSLIKRAEKNHIFIINSEKKVGKWAESIFEQKMMLEIDLKKTTNDRDKN